MIKFGSGTMKPRDDQPSSAQSRRLNLPALLRWLLMVSVLAGPGHAYADANGECTGLNGSTEAIKLQLPASVSFDPDGDLKPYISPPAKFDYTCSAFDGASHTVVLVRLADITPLTNAFRNAGLKLEFLVSDLNGGGERVWDFSVGTPAESMNVGPSYTGTTGNRTMTVRTRLTWDQTKPKPKPGFYVVPVLTSFILKPYYNQGSGLFLLTPSTRLQYVPTCFVQTRLGTNNVDFGPVLTSDVNNSFTRRISFKVTAEVNKNCSGYSDLMAPQNVAIPSGGSQSFWLQLPLKASFTLNNGGVLADDHKSVLLYKKDTHTINGLKLQITNASNSNTPVTFGEISLPDSLSANKFGEFNGDGSKWSIDNTYNAVLSSTGEQVITGKYSAQVTVKVDYY
ncbi:fimbrial protein [Salmonella enterica]|nr:fimbrial protein [Salmonella enterica]